MLKFNEEQQIKDIRGALALRSDVEKVVDQVWTKGFDAVYYLGIGGTYAVMPELYLKIKELTDAGKVKEASEIQYAADAIIYAMCECHGNLYAVMKEILRIRENLNIGGVRKPLPEIIPEDMEQIKKCAGMIDEAIKKYC